MAISPPTSSMPFARAKRHYVERLKAGRIEEPTEVDEVHRRVMEIAGEPLPLGIAPNRNVIRCAHRARADARHHHQAGDRGGAVCAQHARSGGVISTSRIRTMPDFVAAIASPRRSLKMLAAGVAKANELGCRSAWRGRSDLPPSSPS